MQPLHSPEGSHSESWPILTMDRKSSAVLVCVFAASATP
jgi:hypothetical protein